MTSLVIGNVTGGNAAGRSMESHSEQDEGPLIQAQGTGGRLRPDSWAREGAHDRGQSLCKELGPGPSLP